MAGHNLTREKRLQQYQSARPRRLLPAPAARCPLCCACLATWARTRTCYAGAPYGDRQALARLKQQPRGRTAKHGSLTALYLWYRIWRPDAATKGRPRISMPRLCVVNMCRKTAREGGGTVASGAPERVSMGDGATAGPRHGRGKSVKGITVSAGWHRRKTALVAWWWHGRVRSASTARGCAGPPRA